MVKHKKISVDVSRSDLSEPEIADSDSDNSVDKQALQQVEVKSSGPPHSTKNQSRT
jgi:hypothetical protein